LIQELIRFPMNTLLRNSKYSHEEIKLKYGLRVTQFYR